MSTTFPKPAFSTDSLSTSFAQANPFLAARPTVSDAIEAVVGGAVDGGHAAAADPVEDRVAVEKPRTFGKLLLTLSAEARHRGRGYARPDMTSSDVVRW